MDVNTSLKDTQTQIVILKKGIIRPSLPEVLLPAGQGFF